MMHGLQRRQVPKIVSRPRSSMVALLLLAGCATAPIMTSIDQQAVLPPSDPVVEPMSAGDLVEIIYTRTNARQTGPYLLQVGDLVAIDVADQPTLGAKDVRVLPDGRISLPLAGSIPAAGRSVEQVARGIASVLQGKNVPTPDVVVLVQSANQRLEQFLRSAAPETQGSRMQIRLAGDELVSLPLIHPVSAVGRPLTAVRNEITSSYEQLFGSQLDVTVNIREQSEPQVYVWGEVAKPGIQQLKSRMNAAMVVAAAGGPTAVGNHAQILVVRFRPNGDHYHWMLDLTSTESAERSPGFNVPLRNRDVIFVSRKPIGDMNDFIDIYLRKNIPLPLGLGFTP